MDDIEQLKKEIAELKEIIANHSHTGFDGSAQIKTTIEIGENEYFRTGSLAIEGLNNKDEGTIEGAIVVGDDKIIADGSKNSQINIQHLKGSNDTFVFGLRSPIYQSDTGSVSIGGTTMSQTSFGWQTNELAGAYVLVIDGGGDYDVWEIASNTSTTITITGGTWSFSQSGAKFLVFVPVYFGAAQYPWRRLYTLDGVGGGIRFGLGQTNAGQQGNGLLYMDAAGDLYWRNKAGTSTKLN